MSNIQVVWVVDSIYGSVGSDLVLVGQLEGLRKLREVGPVIELDMMDCTPLGLNACVNVIPLQYLNLSLWGKGASLHPMCFKSDPQIFSSHEDNHIVTHGPKGEMASLASITL